MVIKTFAKPEVNPMNPLLSTKEVSQLLNVNEKMVYMLVSEKGLPATKITGKWLFPRHLVEQWIETNTINYPESATHLPPYQGLLIITGSNDPLLEKTISLCGLCGKTSAILPPAISSRKMKRNTILIMPSKNSSRCLPSSIFANANREYWLRKEILKKFPVWQILLSRASLS
jgi:excisionase family DNA binding protein